MPSKPSIRLKAFIAAPASADISSLRAALEAKGVATSTAYDTPPGASLQSHLRNLIEAADLVVGAFPDTSRLNVAFELGIAAALNKRLLVLAPPSLSLPSDLAGFLVLRTELDNTRALDFAIDQILSAKRSPSRPPASRPRVGRSLGPAAETYLAHWRQGVHTLKGRDLEALVAELFTKTGATAITHSPTDKGADLAVWSDSLQPSIGNPIIVEVKESIQAQADFDAALSQLERYRELAKSPLAILVVGHLAKSVQLPRVGHPNVLAVRLEELILELGKNSLSGYLTSWRNRLAHLSGS